MTTRGKLEWCFALALGLALTVIVMSLCALASPRAQAAPPLEPQVRPLRQALVTWTVTTTDDDGPGSLRWALSSAGISDTITFDPIVFPPTAPVTITLTNPLPVIVTDGLVIDASEAGVVLDGNELGGFVNGLDLHGTTGVTVQGLEIQRFPENGIYIALLRFTPTTRTKGTGSRAGSRPTPTEPLPSPVCSAARS